MPEEKLPALGQRAMRLLACVAGLAAITLTAHHVIGVNATTVGYTYLLVILVIASAWGFVEAAVASVAATLAFNFFASSGEFVGKWRAQRCP